jgi:hypothetical protein
VSGEARSPAARPLLEVILEPLWAWLGAGEVPASGTVLGGLLVLGVLAAKKTGCPARGR